MIRGPYQKRAECKTAGHDLTLPYAKTSAGQCRECAKQYLKDYHQREKLEAGEPLEDKPLYQLERGSQIWKALTLVWMLDRREGLTVNQLAQEWKCSPQTAKRWLRVAADSLPVEMQEHDYGGIHGAHPAYYRLLKDWRQKVPARP